ncbi:MAG: flavin reductase [Dehalococcoidia bacterium]|nr:flavin reductase [Dehalococcoidia bacterium]
MGRFATGVTVVTVACDEERRGMTANAVTSVSLDPPLLLVCVARTASIFPLFERAGSFAVNILTADQHEVSSLFAHDGDMRGRTSDVPHSPGVTGAPILADALAYADCQITARYDGGDHSLVLGQVQEAVVARPEAEPLLFFAGKYRGLGSIL